jgi:hypothetical protein
VREKKAGIDARAASLDRSLNPASSLPFSHCNRSPNVDYKAGRLFAAGLSARMRL